MVDNDLLIKAEEFVLLLLEEKDWSKLHYHNEKLIKSIVESVNSLASKSSISQEDVAYLNISAWFYYSGYYLDPDNFQNESVKIADSFLASENCSEEGRKAITKLITTKDSIEVELSELQKILLDGLTQHYAKPKFRKTAKALQKEKKALGNKINDFHWAEYCYNLLSKHRYHTGLAKKKNETGLFENKEWFGKGLKIIGKKMDNSLGKSLQVDEGELKELKKKLQKIEKRPERGVETFFRVASKNLYTRAGLADNKSNIMISINALVLSIVLSTFYSKMEEDPHLIYAVVTLLLTNLISIGYAVMATRPNIAKTHYTKEDIKSHTATIMTFDDFQHMDKADFEWAINEITNDSDYLYLNITRDIYKLGLKLSKKYRFLYYSYTVFLVGLCTAIGLFIACHLFFE